jgi:hypothetical protein
MPRFSIIQEQSGPENDTPTKHAVLTRLFCNAVHLNRSLSEVPNVGYMYCGPDTLATINAAIKDKASVTRFDITGIISINKKERKMEKGQEDGLKC